MEDDIKTFDSLLESQSSKEFSGVKRESIDRMKAALLSVSQDDPFSIATALSKVTILRVYHQVVRIVQYTELMDKLENKLYNSIEYALDTSDITDNATLNYLLTVQYKLQNSIIESNKLLTPYLNMEQYPAFNQVEEATPIEAKVIDLPSADRNLLRENASSILEELESLSQSNEQQEEQTEELVSAVD